MEMTDKYCIVKGYKTNQEKYLSFKDNFFDEHENSFQLHVYQRAKQIMIDNGYNSIIDIGCGSGMKLCKMFSGYEKLGLEIKENYELLIKNRPCGNWMICDMNTFPDKQYDIGICADVIEHISNPDKMMKYLKKLRNKCLLISTPCRELLPKSWNSQMGPPYNSCHVREWTANEFLNYVFKWFDVEKEYTYTYFLFGDTGITVILLRR